MDFVMMPLTEFVSNGHLEQIHYLAFRQSWLVQQKLSPRTKASQRKMQSCWVVQLPHPSSQPVLCQGCSEAMLGGDGNAGNAGLKRCKCQNVVGRLRLAWEVGYSLIFFIEMLLFEIDVFPLFWPVQ